MDKDQNKFELVENRDAIELAPTWELQWWWLAAAIAVVAMIFLIVMFLRRRKTVPDPRKIEREAFERARKELEKLEIGDEVPAPVQISVILRRYLAESLGEPALFQTHEEFIGRHDALANFRDEIRGSIQEFFSGLASLKYAREAFQKTQTDQLRNRSVELLERMHAA